MAHLEGSSRSRRVFREGWTELCVFVAAFALFAIGGRSRLLRDPGTFWHTLTGDQIFAAGFPRADWLSFTFGGHPWIAHQWLGECLMSALHRVGGLDALVVAAASGLAWMFAALFARLLTTGVTPLWSGLVVSLAGAASSLHFHVRPHLLSIFFFAWLYMRLADVDSGRRRVAALWPLPFLFLAWVNAHGAVVGGFATLALFALWWIVTWLAGGRSPVKGRREAATLAAIVAASIATVPLTPYGLDLARAWFAILASPLLPRAIVEHGSLVRTGSWSVLGMIAFYAAALLGTPQRSWSASTLVPLAWLILAFDRIRHAPFFAIASAVAVAELLPRVGWSDALRRRGFEVVSPPSPALLARGSGARRVAISALVALSVAGVSVVAASSSARAPVLARLDPARWPLELVPALRAIEREVPDGAPILNEMLFGGFIAYETPGLRLFVDDRWELYGDDFMLAYLRAETAWLDRWVAGSNVSVALVENGSRLHRYVEADPRWTLTGSTGTALLYRRTGATRVTRQEIAPR